MSYLKIVDLHVEIDGKEILKGVNLEIQKGEVVALMGPNGSGKSTLAYTLMGHPKYEITSGKIYLNDEDITELEADERSKRGLFLSFQYPQEIEGVAMTNFLRTAYNAKQEAIGEKPLNVIQFHKLLTEKMELLKMDKEFAKRGVNHGFSGGEKKKAEIMQMLLLKPAIAVLDETDSGLDVDALRIVSEGVNILRGPDMGVLMITHYQRLLNHISPDKVHIFKDGNVIRSGGKDLALEIEDSGYEGISA